jgi:chloramphenicol O-acetyltransferase type A
MIEKYIDIDTWNRKDHYTLYSSFNQPFFGFSAHVPCTAAYEYCKTNDRSFYLYYLHKILFAVNQIENLRLRIHDDKVALYDEIHVSPTVGREDTTFGFSFMPFEADFDTFEKASKEEIKRVKAATGLCMSQHTWRIDTIHFSAVPWIDFTMVQHAGMVGGKDSCPKVSVGKLTQADGVYKLPVSLHAHHALVDGYHAGQFFELLESYLSN